MQEFTLPVFWLFVFYKCDYFIREGNVLGLDIPVDITILGFPYLSRPL